MDAPQKKLSIDLVLKQAFGYWSATLFYQLIFSIIYWGILVYFLFYLANYYEILDDFSQIGEGIFTQNEKAVEKANTIVLNENFKIFSLMSVVVTSLLYPLQIGFYQIYRKLDLKLKPDFEDLFVGYYGERFFKFVGFYIFWGIIYFYAKSLFFPAIFWVCVTLFVGPLLFFTNIRLAEAISYNTKIFFKYPFFLIMCITLTLFISYSGIWIFGFGYLLTFPFWHAVIYVLFKNFFTFEEKPKS